MTAQQIVCMLNDILKNDPTFAHDLIEKRLTVNNPEWFEKHPGIVMYSTGQVGMLGILNGIAHLDGELIEAVFDDETERLTGFRLREREGSTQDVYADAAV